jgi:hypothetical protein
VTHTGHAVVRVAISRRLQWAGHVAWIGETRAAYRVFVGKPLD